eukprot:scaffold39703_cov191-Amphora_coffeaeformis.AAC.2
MGPTVGSVFLSHEKNIRNQKGKKGKEGDKARDFHGVTDSRFVAKTIVMEIDGASRNGRKSWSGCGK